MLPLEPIWPLGPAGPVLECETSLSLPVFRKLVQTDDHKQQPLPRRALIGARGRMVAEPYESEDLAAVALQREAERKRRRGYAEP